jgi:hypothetical protein
LYLECAAVTLGLPEATPKDGVASAQKHFSFTGGFWEASDWLLGKRATLTRWPFAYFEGLKTNPGLAKRFLAKYALCE